MEIRKESAGDVLTISISGDLDASSAIMLDESMKEALEIGNKKVIVNCQELNYISSAGLGVFISYIDRFKELKARFILYNMQDQVLNVFQILGLDKLIAIIESEKEAVHQINES